MLSRILPYRLVLPIGIKSARNIVKHCEEDFCGIGSTRWSATILLRSVYGCKHLLYYRPLPHIFASIRYLDVATSRLIFMIRGGAVRTLMYCLLLILPVYYINKSEVLMPLIGTPKVIRRLIRPRYYLLNFLLLC